METNEIKNVAYLRDLTARYFNTQNPSADTKGKYTTQISLQNYYELGSTITNMLKMCILALEQQEHKISETDQHSAINVMLILEMVLEMFPLDEFEVFDEINKMCFADS
ncbi:hypothetical protein D0809_01290 [Flavobacterium circumlabens]|uniref:Uncharacterized protein n=1 Tax=Flavobacterium circumlabens TaxID=2133765 RepID=A0A4Y7UGR8_9FLAO|nr:hypothetical protein [Flavobacterium circumlabens]TCN60511.1 hypothetical protein EV142_10177 [Flavobacterium circumlabens]TEB45670.1 hypothetical protein D0809_01290 [Flavobacterium circumlabens]